MVSTDNNYSKLIRTLVLFSEELLQLRESLQPHSNSNMDNNIEDENNIRHLIIRAVVEKKMENPLKEALILYLKKYQLVFETLSHNL